MADTTIGFALCGSFCTFKKVIPQIAVLKEQGFEVIPIMSEHAYSWDTRFGTAASFRQQIEEIAGNHIIATIPQAEPIGPKKLLDALVIEPCTGNTLAKLAGGIADTAVTLAAKSHLRNERPVVIAVSTNDALGAAAANIGRLMNYKNIYFVPMAQDDCIEKPKSIVAHFDKTHEALLSALNGKQSQPVYC